MGQKRMSGRWMRAAFGLMALALVILISSAGGQATKKKEAAHMAEKVSTLRDLASRKSVIRFNGNKFREYVKTSPRNYSMIVMFTAPSSSRQCMICKEAMDEYTVVANSFRYSTAFASNKVFLAMVDFDEGPDVFQLMKLNSAPVFMHFPEKGKPKKLDTMDLGRVGFGAEAIAKFIQERTDVQIRIFRPPNYTGSVALIMIFTMIGSLLYLRRNNLEFLQNKNAWGTMALFFVFAMISGQMWNHIRGPPLVHKTQNGIAYIHGS